MDDEIAEIQLADDIHTCAKNGQTKVFGRFNIYLHKIWIFYWNDLQQKNEAKKQNKQNEERRERKLKSDCVWVMTQTWNQKFLRRNVCWDHKLMLLFLANLFSYGNDHKMPEILCWFCLNYTNFKLHQPPERFNYLNETFKLFFSSLSFDENHPERCSFSLFDSRKESLHVLLSSNYTRVKSTLCED